MLGGGEPPPLHPLPLLLLGHLVPVHYDHGDGGVVVAWYSLGVQGSLMLSYLS